MLSRKSGDGAKAFNLRSIAKRVLSRVAHVQETVLVPGYQKNQLWLNGNERGW